MVHVPRRGRHAQQGPDDRGRLRRPVTRARSRCTAPEASPRNGTGSPALRWRSAKVTMPESRDRNRRRRSDRARGRLAGGRPPRARSRWSSTCCCSGWRCSLASTTGAAAWDGRRMARRPATCRSICASSSPAHRLYGLGVALRERAGSVDRQRSSLATSCGASLQVFVPTFLFCLLTQWLGLYVASFLLVAGFMRFIGRIALWKSLLTSILFARDHVRHVRGRVRRHHAQGTARSGLRLLEPITMEAVDAPASRLRRPADLEDAGADDGRPRARHLRRRAAGTGRTERRRDPVAAYVHDGSDVRHRDAFVHLLGRAVRRGDHVDPVQHSGRSLVGGDDLRRLSDGAAGQGRGGADRGVHVVVHRFAGRGAADHVSRAPHRVVRVALRAAGILCRLPADLLLVRRTGARGQSTRPSSR